MTLEKKFILTILQIALIPWALGGMLAFLSSREQVNSQTYTNLNALAAIQQNRLNDVLQNKLDLLSLFTTNPGLITSARDYSNSPGTATRNGVQQNLTEHLGETASIRRVFIVSTEGIVIASSDTSLLGEDVRGEEYFALGSTMNSNSVLKKDSPTIISQYLAGPLIDGGRVVGVVVVVTDANDITLISKDYTGLGQTGETLIARRSGDNVLFLTPTRFDPDAALTRVVPIQTTNTPIEHALEGEESVFSNLTDYRGVKVFAATRYIGSTDWGVVVKIDQSEAYMPMVKLGQLFFSIIAMVGMLMVFIAISISRAITAPIKELTAFANTIAAGRTQKSIVVTSEDEIGTLGKAFNSMSERLQDFYATLEQKVEDRTKELAEKNEEAKNSERAALNIAADLKIEEEKLAREKERAETLANDLKKFKLALDNTSDQVVITDQGGIVVYANAAVEKITGYKPEEALGKKSGALWKLPMPREYYEHLWHTIKDQKKTFLGEIQNRRKNGEVYTAIINISPVLDENEKIIFFVGLERDISREKEIDEAKSEFISLASHQMRTPLTAINWYTEMLLGGDAGKMTEKQKEYFGEIETAGQRMNQIIKSFLHILRLENETVATNLVPINLIALAKIVIEESRFDIEKKRLRITEHFQTTLPSVSADEELSRVILQNLVTNAVKYSPDGAEITVTLRTVAAGESVAGRVSEHDAVLAEVRDNGIGIASTDKDRIFDKFFRSEMAKRWDPNGNGLGLYMTRKMVNIIHGTIWFESEEGKGSAFYVLFPLGSKKSV